MIKTMYGGGKMRLTMKKIKEKPETRVCSGDCKIELPLTEEYFHRNAQQPWGFHIYCKKCRNKKRKIIYQTKQAIKNAGKILLKKINEECFMCNDKHKTEDAFADNYDSVFFICKRCYENDSNRIKWKKFKRKWSKADKNKKGESI